MSTFPGGREKGRPALREVCPFERVFCCRGASLKERRNVDECGLNERKDFLPDVDAVFERILDQALPLSVTEPQYKRGNQVSMARLVCLYEIVPHGLDELHFILGVQMFTEAVSDLRGDVDEFEIQSILDEGFQIVFGLSVDESRCRVETNVVGGLPLFA